MTDREIKFRAWDKDGVYAKSVPTMHQDIEGSHMWGSFLYDDDFPVMQFTGLQDKDGVEIYEGDIIQLGDDTFFLGADEIVKVAWSSDGYWLYFRLFDKCEVIGNIHENPELVP